jgi:hypothetical protein
MFIDRVAEPSAHRLATDTIEIVTAITLIEGIVQEEL